MPVRQIDLRHEFINLKESAKENLFSLRAIEKLHIDEDTTLAFRFDLQSFHVDELESSGTDFGDILLQGLFIKKLNKRIRHACGIRTIIPTSHTASSTGLDESNTTDETNSEKWDIAPMLGWSVDMPELGTGSFTSLLMRYRFSVLGADSHLSLIHI